MSQTQDSEYTVSITENAAQIVRETFDAEGVDGSQALLRIGAHPGGCSGYKYDMDVTEADQVSPADRIFESLGIRIVVDENCLNEILGSIEIGFQQGKMIESGFTFRQLSTGAQCGCGESFTPIRDTHA